jgi:membrane protease YdiL (CAAX protease family)
MDTISVTLEPSTATSSPPRTTSQRLVGAGQAAAFTAVWIALGLVLDMDPRIYLLTGVPLLIVFQLWVRGRPLRDLWVRGGSPFRLDRLGKRVAVLLLCYPLIALGVTVFQGDWLTALTIACCVPGALAAAYAVRRQRTFGWGPALRAALLAAAVGLCWMVVVITPQISSETMPLAMIGRGLHSLLLYIPVCFVLEEVAFRGAVDAHVHQPGERWALLSAVYVSVLWALWHLPLDIGSEPMAELILGLLLVHVTIGVPLSYAWRRAGNLTLPAVVHAVVDAVRDALSAGT